LQAVFAFDGAFAPDSAAAFPVIAVGGVLAGLEAVVGEHKRGATPLSYKYRTKSRTGQMAIFQLIDSKLDSMVPGVGLEPTLPLPEKGF
jgi:hypothetical protein